MKPEMLSPKLFSRTISLCILLTAAVVHSQGWRWETRLDLSFVRDNNVFESVTEQQWDNVIRLLVETQARGPLSPSSTLSLHYQGGLEAYTLVSQEENRILNIGGYRRLQEILK